MAIGTSGKVNAFSRIPEATYGVPVVAGIGAAKAFQQILAKKADNPVRIEVRTKNNSEFATGTNFATRQYTAEHDASASYSIELDSYTLALILHSVLHTITSSAPYAGAAVAVKQHISKPYDPKISVAAVARTLLEYLANPDNTGAAAVYFDRVLPGAVIQSAEFKGEGSGTIECTIQVVTAGSIVAPSLHNVDFSDTANCTVIKLSAANPFFQNPTARIRLRDVSTLANSISIGCKLRNWMVKIDNKLLAELGYQPHCSGNLFDSADASQGIVRSRMLMEGQDIMVKYQVEMGNIDFQKHLSTQRPFDTIIDFTTQKLIATVGATNYYHNASFEAFNTQFKSVDYSAPNNILVADIESTLLDDGQGVFKSVVENETASYLV
jgi:hypothetical protein